VTRRYAAGTDVPANRSREQIEKVVTRYGADQYLYGWGGAGMVGPAGTAVIQFRAHERYVRFVLPMPDRDDHEFTVTDTGRARTATAAEAAWEQATRQRWRALLLNITAKLEAVDIGLATFEQEFMANIVLPDGSTVSDFMAPQIERAYATSEMPSMLPALGPGTP